MRSGIARVDHAVLCHPHVYPRMEWTILRLLRKHSPNESVRSTCSLVGWNVFYSPWAGFSGCIHGATYRVHAIHVLPARRQKIQPSSIARHLYLHQFHPVSFPLPPPPQNFQSVVTSPRGFSLFIAFRLYINSLTEWEYQRVYILLRVVEYLLSLRIDWLIFITARNKRTCNKLNMTMNQTPEKKRKKRT